MASEPEFRESIGRLALMASERRIALLCTERDPLKCHRAPAGGPGADGDGDSVEHIMGNGTSVTHDELMDRLLRMRNTPQMDLAGVTRKQKVKQAVENQDRRQKVKLAVEDQARRGRLPETRQAG